MVLVLVFLNHKIERETPLSLHASDKFCGLTFGGVRASGVAVT